MTQSGTVCVDIGNSGMRCVLVPTASRGGNEAPWSDSILRVDWPVDHDPAIVSSLIKRSLANWLPSPGVFVKRRWLVSSVQRSMESHLKSIVTADRSVAYHLVTFRDLPLDVEVDFPDKVGIDRLLATLAASQQLPGRPLIVIQAGSAITVDWFEPPKRFGGGAIMPGVPMMLRLLSKAADMLPETTAKELLNLPALPGKNTMAAMDAGVSSAVVGGVQHLVARYRQQFGQETLVVVSGGDGPLLSPHLSGPIQVIDQLVLRGLASLATSLTLHPND